VIAGLLLVAADVSGATIAEKVERYANARLATQGASVANAQLSAGRMRVELTRGVATPVLAGDEEIGFFFRGEGRWTYTSTSPDEFPVMRHNVSEITRWKILEGRTGEISISDSFKEVLWLGDGRPGPVGPPSPAPVSDYQKHVERFGRMKLDTAAQHLAYRALRGPEAGFVWTEFAGGKHECLYIEDTVDASSEELDVLKKSDYDSGNPDWEWGVGSISLAPTRGGFRDTVPPVVTLTAAEAQIEADGEDAKITTTETFVPATATRVVRLKLRSRVFGSSRRDSRPQRLLRVTDGDARALSFDHRNGNLLVELPREAAAGQAVTLRFEMEGKVLPRPGGDSYWLLGFDPWFPRAPELSGNRHTWKCRVRVRKPFVPIVPGQNLKRWEEGPWNLAEASVDRPISFPVVLAGSYHIEERSIDGRTFRIASYAFANRGAVEHLATLASQIIRFYEPFLGEFPWKEFTIVEIRAYGFGIAPFATMFITQEAFSPHRDAEASAFSKNLNARFAHEIAHQYWGHQIKWPDDSEEWLSESFAEYCSALLIQRERGESYYKAAIGRWRQMMKETGGAATLPTANRLAGERAFRDRNNLLYGRGPYLLYVLHREIGDETFWTFLKTFQSNRKWEFGTTALVEDLLQFLTKRAWRDFFERYFWGTEIPVVP
jgi:hypothetical protein